MDGGSAKPPICKIGVFFILHSKCCFANFVLAESGEPAFILLTGWYGELLRAGFDGGLRVLESWV